MAGLPPQPMFQPKSSVPYIPTGYETLRNDIAQKRKIADAMTASGMNGPGPNARSWVQLLGSLAQSLGGTLMERRANKEERQMNGNIQVNRGVAEAQFSNDRSMGMGNTDLYNKYAPNPNLAGDPRLEMLAKAVEAGQKARGDPRRVTDAQGNVQTVQGYEDGSSRPVEGGYQNLPDNKNINGVNMDLSTTPTGTVLPPDYSQEVVLGPDGKPKINTSMVMSKLASQGVIAHAPGVNWLGQDNATGDDVPPGTQPQTAPQPQGSMSPKIAEVAKTLAAKFSPAVTAGFMGNFHVEGGYDGAQGDGGSAHGIAQLRGPRLANFVSMFGRPPEKATPSQQAEFVGWEMDHPQQAGMTVAQRDAIVNAQTPQEAAQLIDKYYERSSGRDRSVRMSAAGAFAGDAKPGLPPSSEGNSPFSITGFIPGSPAADKEQARALAVKTDARGEATNAREEKKFALELADRQANGGVKTTEAQDQAAGHGTIIASNMKLIKDALKGHGGDAKPGLMETFASNFGETARGASQNSRRQVVDQSYRDILDSALYLATGAAYNKEQLTAKQAAYVPSYVDTQSAIQAKRVRMETLVGQARVRAGPANVKVQEALDGIDFGVLYPGSHAAKNAETPAGPISIKIISRRKID